MFAYDGYRSIYVSSLKLSGCGRQIANLTGSTTGMWRLYDPKNCSAESRYHKNDMKPNLKHPDYHIAQNRNGSIHLSRKNVSVKRINKVVGQRSFRQTMFADDENRSPYASSWRLLAYRAPNSPFDRTHDKNVDSIGP